MTVRFLFVFGLLLMFLFTTFAYFYKTISVNYKQNAEIIEVSVKGAVKNSGVYYVERGTPVSFVIDKSGGFTANAVLPEGFDFAMPLYDDTTITIPRAYGFW